MFPNANSAERHLFVNSEDYIMNELRVLELFSGIGGMHYALKRSQMPGTVVAAVDINTVANAVYSHNHPETRLLNNNIQKLSPEMIEKLNVNTILMSPPCQPFTRVGNQLDVDDYRSDALKHICDILDELKSIDRILMENVKGFENSRAHDLYLKCLSENGFDIREFILTPTQFGVPNTRNRYFCIARRSKPFDLPGLGCIQTDWLFTPGSNTIYPASVKDFLEPENTCLDDYLIPDKILEKRAWILDIVTPDDTNTMCFTKAYTHYCEGTGSVFTPLTGCDLDIAFSEIKRMESSNPEYLNFIRPLKMRYFTPKEVSMLMCFPSDFSFPSETTDKQKYRLLGNSINVLVVSELIKLLVS